MKHIGKGLLAVGALFAVLTSTAWGIDGDYNNDGYVDAADYTVWRDNLDTGFTLPNDPTPGNVGSGDYAVWQSNYGSGVPAAPQSPGPDDPMVVVNPLGQTPDGNFALSVAVTKPVGTYSLAVELGFVGPIVQVQVFGMDVDDSVDAESFDGQPGYEMEEDTWYDRFNWLYSNPGYNIFTSSITEGYVQGTDSLFISLGGEPFEEPQIELLHLVLVPPGGTLQFASSAAISPPTVGVWLGVVAMDGVNYSSTGDLVLPEPASLAIAVAAAVTLLGRRRSIAGR